MLGWTLLSRDALRRAESRLLQDSQGVRDEIGFLTLHQVYADRFFPGTSVLHTRLRYALFVPWMYEQVVHQNTGGPIGTRIQRMELWLTGRLKAANEDGVIGGRVYPRPAVQSAAMSYWSALGSWGILRPKPDGSLPSRTAVHRRIRSLRAGMARQLDDDKEPLEVPQSLFVVLPNPPKAWEQDETRLDFNLTPQEARFFRKHWSSLKRRDGAAALFARLAIDGRDVSKAKSAWSPALRLVADSDDRAALERAKRVSALAAIGRAIYAAQVETLRAQEDNLPTPNEWRTGWKVFAAEYWPDAKDLDINSVLLDISSGIKPPIQTVLEETHSWMRRGGRSVLDLLDVYCDSEVSRKGGRARLPFTKGGRERRAEWKADDTPAGPLHYRWPWVKMLITDMLRAL